VFDGLGLSNKDTTNVFVSSLSVFDGEPQKERPVVSLFPNPFNSELIISVFNNFQLEIKSISVYDIRGKKIINWGVSNKNNNKSVLSWRAKDEHGFEIRSGLYFVRIESDKKPIIKKVTYLK